MGIKRRIQAIAIGFAVFTTPAFTSPRAAHAGCGCNKPPPLPATIIPGVAYPGMSVTLYDPTLKAGQKWRVTFDNGIQAPVTVIGTVKHRRDITDSSGNTRDNQLIVRVPVMTSGPTSISAVDGANSIRVESSSFVLMGKPQVVQQKDVELEDVTYSTGVGADGTLYLAVGGLNKVCDAMDFTAYFSNYLLRFSDGDVLIFNWQGYFIDSLTPASHNHFSITPGDTSSSDILDYGRHSFHAYCKAHAPGGSKQVDPRDHNWHRDGTPHVDYADVIFAIKGHFDDGSSSTPGLVSPLLMTLHTELGNDTHDWETEPSDSEE